MAKTISFVSRRPVGQHTQSGMTLIELMLAISLGMFLILGLVDISINVKKTSTLENSWAMLQENGRFIVHFLAQNVRMGGYKDCKSSPFSGSDLAIQGYQNILPPFLQGKVVSNTDSIVVALCKKENDTLKFGDYAYFIGATSRKNALGKPVYALYELPQNSDKRELVSDVENMRIYYGISNGEGKNSDIVSYVTANQVSDWKTVQAVDIAFLLSSADPVFVRPQAYSFMGIAMNPDRYLHKEWEVYIKLRE